MRSPESLVSQAIEEYGMAMFRIGAEDPNEEQWAEVQNTLQTLLLSIMYYTLRIEGDLDAIFHHREGQRS